MRIPEADEVSRNCFCSTGIDPDWLYLAKPTGQSILFQLEKCALRAIICRDLSGHGGSRSLRKMSTFSGIIELVEEVNMADNGFDQERRSNAVLKLFHEMQKARLFFLPFALLSILIFGALDADAAESFYCKFCGEQFDRADNARLGCCLHSSNRKHIAVACKNNKFFCEYCGEKFSNASSVRIGHCLYSSNHKHTLAGGDGKAGKFVCRYCGDTFPAAANVRLGYCIYGPGNKHVLGGECSSSRKYFCSFCGEVFSSPGNVRIGRCLYSANNRHVLSSCASASNVFCRFCGERFSSPSAVRLGVCLHSQNKKHELP